MASVFGWQIAFNLLSRYSVLLLLLGACKSVIQIDPKTKGTKLAAEDGEELDPADALPRPRRAAGESLRAWLATQENRFALQRITDCQAQVLAISEPGKHKDELRAIAKKMRVDINTDTELYHWCFYHLLMRLETQLEQDQLGGGYQTRLQSFIGESKALWVLAMALDRTFSETYYRYIVRKRYMALSQLYFGRSLLPAKGTMRPEDDPEALDEDEIDAPEDDDVGGGDDLEEDDNVAPDSK